MAKISDLPDASLIKILSFLPTKVAVSTSVLAKRWECLWMWLPNLEFHIGPNDGFLHSRLPLHKAPVLESLRLTSNATYIPEDAKLLVAVAVSRCIRELEISSCGTPSTILPTSLFTNKSLVILKLNGSGILLEDVPRNVCLPSLKTLQLRDITYECERSLQRLLSICHVLEDLLLDFLLTKNKMRKFNVTVPSLRMLTLLIPYESDDVDGIVIDTPSLEYFKLVDKCFKRDYYMVKNMPKLVEAYVNVIFSDVTSLLGSMTSVTHLTLCHCLGSLQTKVDYGGFGFNELEHLKLCVCFWHRSNLLNPLLKDSPNLRSLELFRTSVVMGYTIGDALRASLMNHFGCIKCWNEPIMVPECVLSSLQIFTWSSYSGSQAERDIAVYILKNARCLKTVRISSEEDEVPKLEMLKKLALASRASTCQLIFD